MPLYEQSMEYRIRSARSRKRRRRPFRYALVWMLILLLSTGVFGFWYIRRAQVYKERFFANTYLNGFDVSEKTAAEAEDILNTGVRSYHLRLLTRLGEEEIKAEDLGLRIEAHAAVENLLRQQNAYAWFLRNPQRKELRLDTFTHIDEGKFQERLAGSPSFDPYNIVEPRTATISDYVPGTGYQLIPATEGIKLDTLKAEKAIREAVVALQTELDFDLAGLYEPGQIPEQEAGLEEKLKLLNLYTGSSISYAKVPLLNGDTIHQWLVYDAAGNISLDESKINAYVQELAAAYNTAEKERSLITSYGSVVTVPAGNYGWKIDEKEEAKAIKNIILQGQQVQREPVFIQKAASLTGADYGNSYVEVNLSSQHLFLYKNGVKVLESDFVSGNTAKKKATPAGIFALSYKQRNAVLSGEGYETPVDYWMPFNGDIGFHDAGWRSAFGGQLYKTRGSHGCINMPPENAKLLYESIEAGFPILCYHLEGSESKTSTKVTPTVTRTGRASTVGSTRAAQTEESTIPNIIQSSLVPTVESTKGPATMTSTKKGPHIPTTEGKGPGVSTAAQENTTQEGSTP